LSVSESARSRVLRQLPEFCGGCLIRKNLDCDYAESPEALERCRYVQTWLQREMMK
jgi:hypothetical protein